MEKHHAYVFFADSIEESEIPLEYKKSSTDVLHIVTPRFGIDDARSLSKQASQQPFEAKSHVFVIHTDDIAIEAQNALLKLFEEPPQHALFYLVLKKTSFLLPTLLSRLSVGVAKNQVLPTEVNEVCVEFMALSMAERMTLIASKTKDKDSSWIESILEGCEVWAISSPKNADLLLKHIVFTRMHHGTKGASSKMLLENLALSLPQK